MKGKMKDKMKRDRGDFFSKNVSRPSTPPDELAQNVSKKKKNRRTNYSSIFLKKFRIWPFFNYLHDSNSIFWAQGIQSEWVSGGTVLRQFTFHPKYRRHHTETDVRHI